jgi:signal transduction histidine kinase
MACLGLLAKTTFLSKFENLEFKNIAQKEKIIENSIKKDLDTLALSAADWGFWSATYNFLKTNSNDYIEENLTYESIANLKVELMVFTKGNRIFDSRIMHEEHTTPLTESFKKKILEKQSIFAKGNKFESVQAVVDFKESGIWLIAVNQISNSAQTEFTNGTFLIGKRVNQQYFDKINETLNLKTKLIGVKSSQVHTMTKVGETFIHDISIETMDKSFLTYRISHNTDIIKTGRDSFILFIALSATLVSIILGVAFVLIQKSVFNKLLQIVDKVNKLEVSNLEEIELTTSSSSQEILTIVRTINQLISRVKEDYDLLVQKGKFESLGLMAGGVAHEINNPLTIIKGNTSRLLKLAQSEDNIDVNEFKTRLNKNLNNVKRITDIIHGMKKLSRQSVSDDFIEISANEIIKDVQSLQAGFLPDQDIKITYNLLNQDTTVKGLPPQIIQIIVNLIINASHAISGLSNRWINVEITNSNGLVNFNVIDSGDGISEEDRDKIMDPFYTTKKVGEGTGLGLSICKKIAHFHKGELLLDFDNKNTKFTLVIPESKNVQTSVA